MSAMVVRWVNRRLDFLLQYGAVRSRAAARLYPINDGEWTPPPGDCSCRPGGGAAAYIHMLPSDRVASQLGVGPQSTSLAHTCRID